MLASMKFFTFGKLLRIFTGSTNGHGETSREPRAGDGRPESIDDHRQTELEGRTFSDDRSPPQKDRVVVEGPWAGLMDEALAQIFDRLPFEDRCRTVPLVCKEWRNVARSASSWRNVDMEPWMKAKANEDCYWEAEVDMTRIVRAVVDLSGGQLRQLRTGYCANKSVNYIAENCPLLRELSIRNSLLVDDESAMNLARRCRHLEKLDISDCYNISAKSVELFGMNCPSLTHFTRNMIDILLYDHDDFVAPLGDEEAVAVATYMPGLKQLEMKRMTSLTDFGLLSIARSCPQLESLDLACCTAISSQALDSVVNLCQELKNFVRPIKVRMHVAESKYFVPGLYIVSY